MIMIGFLNIMSSEVMIEFSTSATSPVIRDMMSPLRSLVKKPIGRLTTLRYTKLRMSRTTPPRKGMMQAELRYAVMVLAKVMTMSHTPNNMRVQMAPLVLICSATNQ